MSYPVYFSPHAWTQFRDFSDQDHAEFREVFAALAEDPLPREESRTIRTFASGSETIYEYQDESFRYGVFYRIGPVRGEEAVTIAAFAGPRPDFASR